MPVRTLCPKWGWICPRKGVDTRRCASKDTVPQIGVDLGAVPHRLEERKSASENAGPQGWIVMSHIDRRGEQTTLYKGMETFPLADGF